MDSSVNEQQHSTFREKNPPRFDHSTNRRRSNHFSGATSRPNYLNGNFARRTVTLADPDQSLVQPSSFPNQSSRPLYGNLRSPSRTFNDGFSGQHQPVRTGSYGHQRYQYVGGDDPSNMQQTSFGVSKMQSSSNVDSAARPSSTGDYLQPVSSFGASSSSNNSRSFPTGDQQYYRANNGHHSRSNIPTPGRGNQFLDGHNTHVGSNKFVRTVSVVSASTSGPSSSQANSEDVVSNKNSFHQVNSKKRPHDSLPHTSSFVVAKQSQFHPGRTSNQTTSDFAEQYRDDSYMDEPPSKKRKVLPQRQNDEEKRSSNSSEELAANGEGVVSSTDNVVDTVVHRKFGNTDPEMNVSTVTSSCSPLSYSHIKTQSVESDAAYLDQEIWPFFFAETNKHTQSRFDEENESNGTNAYTDLCARILVISNPKILRHKYAYSAPQQQQSQSHAADLLPPSSSDDISISDSNGKSASLATDSYRLRRKQNSGWTNKDVIHSLYSCMVDGEKFIHHVFFSKPRQCLYIVFDLPYSKSYDRLLKYGCDLVDTDSFEGKETLLLNHSQLRFHPFNYQTFISSSDINPLVVTCHALPIDDENMVECGKRILHTVSQRLDDWKFTNSKNQSHRDDIVPLVKQLTLHCYDFYCTIEIEFDCELSAFAVRSMLFSVAKIFHPQPPFVICAPHPAMKRLKEHDMSKFRQHTYWEAGRWMNGNVFPKSLLSYTIDGRERVIDEMWTRSLQHIKSSSPLVYQMITEKSIRSKYEAAVGIDNSSRYRDSTNHHYNQPTSSGVNHQHSSEEDKFVGNTSSSRHQRRGGFNDTASSSLNMQESFDSTTLSMSTSSANSRRTNFKRHHNSRIVEHSMCDDDEHSSFDDHTKSPPAESYTGRDSLTSSSSSFVMENDGVLPVASSHEAEGYSSKFGDQEELQNLLSEISSESSGILHAAQSTENADSHTVPTSKSDDKEYMEIRRKRSQENDASFASHSSVSSSSISSPRDYEEPMYE